MRSDTTGDGSDSTTLQRWPVGSTGHPELLVEKSDDPSFPLQRVGGEPTCVASAVDVPGLDPIRSARRDELRSGTSSGTSPAVIRRNRVSPLPATAERSETGGADSVR